MLSEWHCYESSLETQTWTLLETSTEGDLEPHRPCRHWVGEEAKVQERKWHVESYTSRQKSHSLSINSFKIWVVIFTEQCLALLPLETMNRISHGKMQTMKEIHPSALLQLGNHTTQFSTEGSTCEATVLLPVLMDGHPHSLGVSEG